MCNAIDGVQTYFLNCQLRNQLHIVLILHPEKFITTKYRVCIHSNPHHINDCLITIPTLKVWHEIHESENGKQTFKMLNKIG